MQTQINNCFTPYLWVCQLLRNDVSGSQILPLYHPLNIIVRVSLKILQDFSCTRISFDLSLNSNIVSKELVWLFAGLNMFDM